MTSELLHTAWLVGTSHPRAHECVASAIVDAVDPKQVAAVGKGLDGAFARAADETETYDPERDRIIVFSDHHRGRGDKADDFRTNVHAYTAALGYYLEQDYRLFLLGDGEELWEERPGDVLGQYKDVLALEAEFRKESPSRLERFWGNHDDLWGAPDAVTKFLEPEVAGPMTVREGLRMKVRRPERDDVTLFFVHGHQGTAESDRFGKLSRWPVRYIWRPIQRLTGYSATTPASRHNLREPHDRAMFEWAVRRGPGLILIAGHTHRPVFASSIPDPPPTRPIAELQNALETARAMNDVEAASAVRAELEYAKTAERRKVESITSQPPCYFNTGCCSYPDGDVTGLELADGEIRLVRWPANLKDLRADLTTGVQPECRVMARADLYGILDAVDTRSQAPQFETHLVGAANE